jgi:hypothetical protein
MANVIGNDVTGSDVTWSDVIFSYYSSSTTCSTVVQVAMATGTYRRSHDPEGVPVKGCAHAQPEVALYPPYRGLFTRNDVIKRHVNSKRFPWKGEVSACATGSRGFVPIRKHFDQKWGHQSSPVWLPLEVMCLEMPLGCSLGRPSLSFSTPFTGYFTAISMGSTYNNYISYVCCFRICCVLLQVVYHVRVAFCYIFSYLLTFYSLIVRFCYIFFVNFLSVTTFLDSFL